MEAKEGHTETAALLTLVGWLFGAVGVLVTAAGVLYAVAGWRYGTVIAIWAAEWGLPLFGVGLGLAQFRRRGTGIVAVVTGLVSVALFMLGRMSREYDPYVFSLLVAGAAVVVGAASVIRQRRGRSLSPRT